MAMTNLIYNPPTDIHSTHPLPPPPQPPKYANFPTTNLSNLSPIYEGEIFASPTNTISPSISHNTIDNNHVALFNGNINPNTHIKISSDQISPTTSISSSNSSNTPTPTTTCHTTSNSLFNIPSTNNNPPCIPPCIPSVSKTSTSSSSPSPSLDTTVSPVTKMDLFRDLKIFEDTETDEYNEQNNMTIDYLTGDKYINNNKNKNKSKKIIVKNKKHKSKKKSKNKNKKHKKSKNNNNIKVNGHSSPYINNNIESDGSSNSNANTPVINGSNVQYEPSVDFPNIYNIPRSMSHINTLSVHCNGINNGIPPPKPQPPLPQPHSPLNNNKYKRKKIKIKSRRHRDKKKNKKSVDKNSHCDSDSELQKKDKIRDKIKNISVRVPGDPNGLFKYWKRTSSKSKSKYKPHKSPIKDCHLNIFSENKEDELNMKKILNIDESFKLSMNPISNIAANRNRDRLNSYPPKNMIYSIKSPHILSSPSSSMSNSNNSMSSMPNIICNKRKIKHIPIKLKKSQSCSNLLSSSIIIHTPTKTSNNINKNNDENKQENCNEMTYNFSVLGLKNYTPNIPKKHRKKKHYKDNNNQNNNTPNICGYNIMKDYSLNRIRINSFAPNITVPSLTDIVIERTPNTSNTVSPIHTPINDDNKDEEWHYTSKKKKKSHNKNGKYYGMRSSYYYTNNYATGPYNKDIPIYKWNDNENDSTEIPSLPIQSLSVSQPTNRKHINININKKYNIHPSMVGTSMGKLYDL